MVDPQYFEIIGTGSYLPKCRLTDEDIDRRIDRPKGWTRENVGVLYRYQCKAPESLITMGAAAIESAMRDAEVDWSDIDLLLDCSACRYRPIPCNAAHVMQHFGEAARSIACFDVQSTCLGFIVALRTANGLMSGGNFRNIIVVASEAGLGGVNWGQPESAGLIGDGAAAAVLAYRPDNSRQMISCHQTHAKYLELCTIDGGGHFLGPYDYTEENRHRYQFDMNGPAVFRTAIKLLPRMIRGMMPEVKTHFDPDLINVIPHQASPKAVDLMREMLGYPAERFQSGVSEFGNLIAASIPLMLDRCRRAGKINKGDPLMLLGTSAGYSQAATVFQY